jgi:hypothetical protein
MQPLYTVREAADILRLPIRTVQQYAPQLGGKKFGRVWRFLPEVVERARREGIRGRGRPRGRA